ncbi:MAG TPA: hypothetical protein VIY48_19930 [Candidatus Paceibacterota bacterium]
MAGTPSGTISLDSGSAADATLIGSAEFTTTGVSSWNAGDFTMPAGGLMVVLLTGRDGTGVLVSNISIGGSVGTGYKLWAHATNVDKNELWCRQVSSGANNVTITFNTNTAATCWMVISVWYISGQTSDVPRDADATVTGSVTSVSLSTTGWGKSVTIYNWAGNSATSAEAWTGDAVTTDVAFNAVGGGTNHWSAAHNRNTSADLVARTVGVSWTTGTASFMAVATFK